MKTLTFQADSFSWTPFSKTIETAEESPSPGSVSSAVVVFIHVERKDEDDVGRSIRKLLKHIKWIAGKGEFESIVLHSFTHLGGETAEPTFALHIFETVRERLLSVGYTVSITPFGYFSAWDIAVRGESMAKVWKEF